MKKINLKGISEILSEKEMKNVMGGSMLGTCGWSNGTYTLCGFSKDVIMGFFYVGGGNWCCDSCSSSSYCG